MNAPVNALRLDRALVKRRERRPVTMRGYAARQDGATTEILVVDLSYDGCGIEVPVELKAGEVIEISVLQRGAVKAVVRWYLEGKAGLVFQVERTAPRGPRARQSERIALVADVTTRRVGKAKYRVPVFDVSPEGCRIDLVERPRVGEHMFIKFDGIEALDAEVCWVRDHCAGLRFERPFHPAVFDLLLARLLGAAQPG